MSVLIDRPGIARLIPHAGDMCLLDLVSFWDQQLIRCSTRTHNSPRNPMLHAGRLGILCGVEYAAQAMALHGALTRDAEGVRKQGFLASVRALRCHAERLDDVPGVLHVTAERLVGEGGRVIYSFAVLDGARVMLEGRAAVVIGEIQS